MYINMKNKRETLQYALVIALFAAGIVVALLFSKDNPQYDMILSNGGLLAEAFFGTIFVSVTTLLFSLILGLILFMMMRSKIIILKAISTVFNEIIMGTPLLVLIFLIVYVLGAVIGYNDKLVLGIAALVLYNSPYIANAYQTTAAVVDDDQYIVMDLYQFKWYQRYIYVIIPQMIKPFIPSLINNLSSAIKSSSLLNIISVTEITYLITVIAQKNFAFIEGYYVMWLMYLAVTIPLSILAKQVGKKVLS